MTRNLYLTATEKGSGKSAVALGLVDLLLEKVERPGFFRPIINDGPEARDDLDLIASRYQTKAPKEEMYAFLKSEVIELASRNEFDRIWEGIIEKYKKLEERFDFILCEGSDFSASTSTFEFDINAEVAEVLSSPVLLVANGHQKNFREILQSIEMSLSSLLERGCDVIATLINRVEKETGAAVLSHLKKMKVTGDQLFYTLPSDSLLPRPTVREIAEYLNAEVLYGHNLLEQHVFDYVVAAMHLQNMLEYVQYGSFIIVPGDRADVIIAALAAVASRTMPYISGIILTGGFKPEGQVRKLIDGFKSTIPILSVEAETYPTARKIEQLPGGISSCDEQKIIRALSLFEENVDGNAILERISKTMSSGVSPKMFKHGLLHRARENPQHIVLPEGEDERILRATETILNRKVARITLLGEEESIRATIVRLGLKMDGVKIINPVDSPRLKDYALRYVQLRKHKGATMDEALDEVRDYTYFATMMVETGDADGMVSGATHTTGNTIRPALQLIKTQPGFSIVSSVFFMCLRDKVLVYGDCAVNPDPDDAQLAEIAISSARTARLFGVKPVVAMLSYSSGESGEGEDVEKVRRATKIARRLAEKLEPDLKIEGPMQYDSAVDPDTARQKMPESEVAGRATVFIFPDLDTGNITYKAVQRSARAVAVGPVLQGLKKPVNDLSRGCSIPDIVNTVAITAIQADALK